MKVSLPIKEPLLFNDKTRPVTDQILEMMEYMGYDKDAVEYARIQMKEKKNMQYALTMAQNLAVQFVGECILKSVESLAEDDVLEKNLNSKLKLRCTICGEWKDQEELSDSAVTKCKKCVNNGVEG